MIEEKNSLVVLWASGDRDVALNMVFMYALNAKKYEWWEEVILIVWGPSARLASEDKEIQSIIGQMKETGVILEACKACSDQYGVSSDLKDLGIEVKYMGMPLTSYLKENRAILAL